MTASTPVSIGVGFDTARYGHRVSFLGPDRRPAAKPLNFTESPKGYEELREAFERLQKIHGSVHFHIRIDAAGQYAANLERFLRALPWEKTISVGQPKQNHDYRAVHFPKRKADAVDAQACARFAIVEQPAATPEMPPEFAQLQELAGAVESQAKQTTRLVNQLHNRLARTFPELALNSANLSANWVLRLLAKYPSPAQIAAAELSSLVSIPHLTPEKAEKIQAAARDTVASQRGPLIEGLIRQSVQSVQLSRNTMRELMALLEQAYDALPPGPHRQLETIPGIGKQTAAALVAKIVRIDRFATPGSLVNYFGVFPEENTSGVDKHGQPVPAGTMRMSPKGNDRVRRCLWNAAKTAVLHNPVIRSLYTRLRGRGKRGGVALGHCMRKLLHLVFAVWKTDQPFVPRKAEANDGPEVPDPEAETAGGRKGQGPQRQAVTPTPSNVAPPSHPSNLQPSPPPVRRIDFAQLREQVSMEQVLRELQVWERLKGHGAQRRGPCPIHEPSNTAGRSFSVNLQKKAFQCFDVSCGAKGNVLDLWAQSRHLTLSEAARDLAEHLGISQE
jgi:transposase